MENNSDKKNKADSKLIDFQTKTETHTHPHKKKKQTNKQTKQKKKKKKKKNIITWIQNNVDN